MTKLGLKDFKSYCYDGCFIRLTGSTLAFSRGVLIHVDSAVKVLYIFCSAFLKFKGDGRRLPLWTSASQKNRNENETDI